MFAAIYAFHVKPGHEAPFREAWRELTKLIRDHEGGLGSRLHHAGDDLYIAYAQWPDRETWDASGDKAPKAQADKARALMREACTEVKTLHQMQMLEDFLVEPDAW